MFLGKNIRFLRKKLELTQEELAHKLGVNRAVIGSYEEDRAVPRIQVMQHVSEFFNISMDDLVNTDLEENRPALKKDLKGRGLRVLTQVVNEENKELITLVPHKATAGYLNGYADPEFIEELPRFSLPLPETSRERTYRAFQIMGDSMDPIPDKAYIMCEYLQDWYDVKDGKSYVFVTKDEGITYKRAYNFLEEKQAFLLRPDNPAYDEYWLPVEQIHEIWRAIGYMSFELPEPENMGLSKLSYMVRQLQKEINELKKGREE